MSRRRPGVIAQVIAAGAAAGAVPIDWDQTSRLFGGARSYWVATTSDRSLPPGAGRVMTPARPAECGEPITSRPVPAAGLG